MSCKKLGIVGKIVDRSTPSLVRGADSFIVTQIKFKGTDSPAGFDSFIAASGFFPSTTGQPLVVEGTLESADLGTVRFDFSATSSVNLTASDAISFEQHIIDSRGLTIVIFNEAIGVVDRLF